MRTGGAIIFFFLVWMKRVKLRFVGNEDGIGRCASVEG